MAEAFEVKEMMFGTNEKYLYQKCANCGVLQIDQPVNDKDKLYPSDYYSFNYYKNGKLINLIKGFLLRKVVQKELGSKDVVAAFLSLFQTAYDAKSIGLIAKKQMAILDVGCGTGALVNSLAQNGYTDVTGIDPFVSGNIFGKGFTVLKKYLSQLDASKKYDLIMMHHSFEHMPDPLGILMVVKGLLSLDGTCLIRIPVADSFAFKKYRTNWVQLDAPRHIFIHTDKSLQLLSEKAGLEIYKVVDDSTKFQFIGSEQYLKNIPLNSPISYFVSPNKKFFFNKRHIFSSRKVQEFKKRADELNKTHRGDQRAYFLHHASPV